MKSYFVLAFLFLLNPLFSFTPGKWSHMDKYILGLEKNGPIKEIVRNTEGKVTYTAEYEYDVEGKLVKETYSDKDGKSDGETLFFYEKTKVASEELYNSDKILKEKKKYKYNMAGNLIEIELYSGDGKLQIKSKIHSVNNGLITEAETIWVDNKETESFAIKKDDKIQNVYNQEIFNDKKKLTAEVKYTYDKNGKLQQRENFQGNQLRLNRLTYNNIGKLENFSFHVKQGDKWNLLKTHYLLYKQTNILQNDIK